MWIGSTCIPLIDFSGNIGCLKTESLDEDLIKKILTNIVNNPEDKKFRKLSMASKILNDAQYSTIVYLQNIGFRETPGRMYVHTRDDGTGEMRIGPECLMFTGHIDDLRSLVY
jgi:hypothetical protein